MKEKFTSFFRFRKKSPDALDRKVQRDVAIFSRQAHEQVIAELRQERLDQERATGEGMPEPGRIR